MVAPRFQEGELGQIQAGSRRYSITWEDLLWAGRMLEGEPGREGRVEWSMLIWTYAQRLVRFPRSRTLTNLIQNHSQPVNPKWRRDGIFCEPSSRNYRGRPGADYDPCSPDKLDRRDRIGTLQWDDIDPNKRRFLVDWARAEKPNPIPRSIDFAAFGFTSEAKKERLGWQTIYGRPGSNEFLSDEESRSWPENYVRVVYQNKQSTVSNIEQVRRDEEPNTTRRRPDGPRPQTSTEEELREDRITSNRTAPPEGFSRYWVLESEAEDPQALFVLSEDQKNAIIVNRYTRYYNQVFALQSATTLEFAQSVPVLEIKTQDENGNIVSLNEIIFSRSPIENFQASEKLEYPLPERPVASIVSWQVKVQTVSSGGDTAVSIGTLALKIHNPFIVKGEHPQGKYIAWMLRHGFWMRVKYGRLGPNETAFQWKEEDFIVSQHNLSLNNDNTWDLSLTLTPATQKLSQQMLVGESIPFSELGDEPLTEQDIRDILQNITGDQDLTQDQVNQISNRIRSFQAQFNSGRPSPGYRLTTRPDAQGNPTIGSVLHGAISQSNILDRPEGTGAEVVVENSIDAIKTIQSLMLTRRFENLLNQYSYKNTLKGVERVVVNFGVLMYEIVWPEFLQIAAYVSQNNLEIGEKFSVDGERSSNRQSGGRTDVKMVFGNFNLHAGQWANKPISTFPINANAIFAELRRKRDVGQFSSTINNFITTINGIINQAENYFVEQQEGTENENRYPIERPQIRYEFYPDPTDETSWILYFYDDKERVVRFREAVGTVAEQDKLTREEKQRRLTELNIPWIEIGQDKTIIKNMMAKTSADGLVGAHFMVQANNSVFTSREQDGSRQLPGISRDFMAGAQVDPQNIIRSTAIVLPLELNLTTEVIPTSILLYPIYIFFPARLYEGIYQAFIVEHEIREGMTQTRLTLRINITPANVGNT